jgi:hypothetical protein
MNYIIQHFLNHGKQESNNSNNISTITEITHYILSDDAWKDRFTRATKHSTLTLCKDFFPIPSKKIENDMLKFISLLPIAIRSCFKYCDNNYVSIINSNGDASSITSSITDSFIDIYENNIRKNNIRYNRYIDFTIKNYIGEFPVYRNYKVSWCNASNFETSLNILLNKHCTSNFVDVIGYTPSSMIFNLLNEVDISNSIYIFKQLYYSFLMCYLHMGLNSTIKFSVRFCKHTPIILHYDMLKRGLSIDLNEQNPIRVYIIAYDVNNREGEYLFEQQQQRVEMNNLIYKNIQTAMKIDNNNNTNILDSYYMQVFGSNYDRNTDYTNV